AAGSYIVDLIGAGGAKATHTVKIANQNMTEKLEFGFVQAGPGRLLQPGGLHQAPFEVGSRTVTVSDEAGTHPVTVRVKVGATVIAN
ncbi:MAG: hypothetical protein JWO36_1548, partial [Myxococcales bacterium]|nr:hypothetical protein [Myxococcales bacterium]